MARNASRPGRTLVIFGLVVACLYAGVALSADWKPKLGLDLQGGTRITLEASTESGEKVTPEKLAEAAGIIDSRVNGSGIAEAEVSTGGDRNIVVEIPGQNRADLVDTVKQTAQLRFRLVAATGAGVPAQTDPDASPSASGSAEPSPEPSQRPSKKATPKGRALSSGLVKADESPSAKPSKTSSAQESTEPSTAPSEIASTLPEQPATTKGAPVGKPLEWMRNPGSRWTQAFNAYTCPASGETSKQAEDLAGKPLITCGDDGAKYLLSAAMIQGTQLKDASAGIPQSQVQWVVDLSFDNTARDVFADVTRSLAGTGEQFAIVLDGNVISAPTVIQPITGGNAQITGDFSQEEAQTLANSLKYGALPLKFTAPVVTEEGPSLAADQLSAGIWAGAVGLSIVLVYCLLYYRGLGLVVVASLMLAAAITYAVVLVMSASAGFTLTLPGIAGLIVAVGITADSFVVYFERIRDEMRDGKSMRVAVELGWLQARRTCLAADAVSLLAAVVLFIFAIGVVKGFAFALGICTLIDIVVFFWFTKPMVSWLANFPFFNTGHKLSGLDAESLGLDRLPGGPRTSPAGGNA